MCIVHDECFVIPEAYHGGYTVLYNSTFQPIKNAHLLKLCLQFTLKLKLDVSYMFRPTTIIRELAIEPG